MSSQTPPLAACPLPEGGPYAGVDFLEMHGSMIEVLRAELGERAIVDPEGRYKTFNELLDGWNSDEKLLTGLADEAKLMQSMINGIKDVYLPAVNDFNKFATEDDWGTFVQNNQLIESINGDTVTYNIDSRPGMGIHTRLHTIIGWSQKERQGGPRSQALDVGAPR